MEEVIGPNTSKSFPATLKGSETPNIFSGQKQMIFSKITFVKAKGFLFSKLFHGPLLHGELLSTYLKGRKNKLVWPVGPASC